MKLGHILICHSTDPTRAVESIPHTPDTLWYVFLHSEDKKCFDVARKLTEERDANVFAYRFNRGLSTSWNEGMHLAFEAGCEAVLLLNDDLFFYEEGYASFRSTIETISAVTRSVSYVTVLGRESGQSTLRGQVIAQHFACCAIMRTCVERIGYFDENFFPAYYEDIDFDKRASLAGFYVHVDDRILVEHERSSTLLTMSEDDRQFVNCNHTLNANYFSAKWGDEHQFLSPFQKFDLSIPFKRRFSPYGSGSERKIPII